MQQMSFPDNTFDAVYAIEATVHAPSLEGIYSQIFRVLKPGGVFGVYVVLVVSAAGVFNNYESTRTLAHELGKDNIRVNAVLPGAIVTERQKRLWLTKEYEAEILSRQALKRLLQPEVEDRLGWDANFVASRQNLSASTGGSSG